MPRYYFKKEDLKFDNIEHLCLYFDNNELISLSKDEILDFSFEFQDRLVFYKDGIYPVVKVGYINFNIKKYSSGTVRENFIYNEKDYRKNRKEYIINRCMEGGIVFVKFFFWNYKSIKVFGNFKPILNDNVSFQILDSNNESNSDKFFIDLPNPKKAHIDSVTLYFDNCDYVDLLHDDLFEVNLVFDENLILNSSFQRIIIGGIIKIKFDKDYKYRKGDIYNSDDYAVSAEEIIDRFLACDEHDICDLSFHYTPGNSYKETISIKDIRCDSVADYLNDECDEMEEELYFVGGHISKENDVIIITFK